jgi:hypothetical protein
MQARPTPSSTKVSASGTFEAMAKVLPLIAEIVLGSGKVPLMIAASRVACASMSAFAGSVPTVGVGWVCGAGGGGGCCCLALSVSLSSSSGSTMFELGLLLFGVPGPFELGPPDPAEPPPPVLVGGPA